jgi:hypothetical protein
MEISLASLGAEPGPRFLEQLMLDEPLGFHFAHPAFGSRWPLL